MMMPIENPRTNPLITARDRKLEIHPAFAIPSARYTTPVVIASAAVIGTASSVPIAAMPTSGATTAAETAATLPLGPCTTCFEVPKIA